MAASGDNHELNYELPPFIKVYDNGFVERLIGTEVDPPCVDEKTRVRSKDIVISSDTGFSARLYKPEDAANSSYRKIPVVIYFHGGAFCTQTASSPTYQPFLYAFVAEANVILISVNYRLAPEHPLPIGYDDSCAAVKWVISHYDGGGQEMWLNEFADFKRVFLMGDSAGGNVAHNTAMRVGTENLTSDSTFDFEGLILMHPYFLGRGPVGREETDIATRDYIEKIWTLACPTSSGTDDPWVNPRFDPNLSRLGFQRIIVFAAEDDVLKYGAWDYYEAVRKSGWGGSIEIVETPGEEHVFHFNKPDCEKTLNVIKQLASFITCNIM